MRAKKFGIFILFILLLTFSPRPETDAFRLRPEPEPGKRFFLGIWGGYFSQSSGDFRDVYGSSSLCPEVKTGIKIYKNFYLWCGYGYFSSKGETLVFAEETTFSQHFLSLGPGFRMKLAPALSFAGEIGIYQVKYKEEALGEQLTGTAPGFRVNLGMMLSLSRSFFADVSVSYLWASEKIDGVSFKLGGLKPGIGIGIRF
jgi:hypothetical protein